MADRAVQFTNHVNLDQCNQTNIITPENHVYNAGSYRLASRTTKPLLRPYSYTRLHQHTNTHLLNLLQLPDLVFTSPATPQLDGRARRRIPMIREVGAKVGVVRRQESTPPRHTHGQRTGTTVKATAHVPHTVLHALLVFDAPRVRRSARNDLLSVPRVAGGGEVLSAPRRFEVVRLIAVRFLEDPLQDVCSARYIPR